MSGKRPSLITYCAEMQIKHSQVCPCRFSAAIYLEGFLDLNHTFKKACLDDKCRNQLPIPVPIPFPSRYTSSLSPSSILSLTSAPDEEELYAVDSMCHAVGKCFQQYFKYMKYIQYGQA